MRRAIKRHGKQVNAYQLGVGDPMEDQLINEGVIVDNGDGTYELFSQEAVNGSGQIARAGDYFKIDDKGGKHFPYPNEKSWFEANHKHICGNMYEQIPAPVKFYQLGDEGDRLPSEIKTLCDSKLLVIDKKNPEKTFTAKLWGADLSLPANGAVVIYGQKEDGTIDFNLVQAEEFNREYLLQDDFVRAFQNLLFHEPLYQFVDKENSMNILVLGWDLVAEVFVDQCLQTGQMDNFGINITVVTKDAEKASSEYLAERPAMAEFVNIKVDKNSGSLEDIEKESYGNLTFLTFKEMDGLLDDDSREGVLCDIADHAGVLSDEKKFHYFLVSVGDDSSNYKIADVLNEMIQEWEIAGTRTVHCVRYEKKEESNCNGEEPIVSFYATDIPGDKEIDQELDRLAFNVHLAYSDSNLGNIPRAYEAFREDKYNYRSSVAMALSIKYRLADLNISMEDLDAAAEKFAKLRDGGQEDDKLHRLAALEHRRWVLYMAADGWQAPELSGIEDFYDKRVEEQNLKDEDHKLHLCMVRSRKDVLLSAESFDFNTHKTLNEGLESLDEIDRVSMITHRVMSAKANDSMSPDSHLNQIIMELQDALYQQEIDDSVLKAWQWFHLCLKYILDRNQVYSKKYNQYRNSFIDAISIDGTLDENFFAETIEKLDREIWPILQSNKKEDFKQKDIANINKIPFFLTYRKGNEKRRYHNGGKELTLAMSFYGGPETAVTGNTLFRSVASATIIRPNRILYLLDISQESDPDNFCERVSRVKNYFEKRDIVCELHFIVSGPSDWDDMKKKEWVKCFENLGCSHEVSFAEPGQSSLSKLCEIFSSSKFVRDIDCYDASVPICASVIDNAEFLKKIKNISVNDPNNDSSNRSGKVEKIFPCFEFSSVTQTFSHNKNCRFLSYIEGDFFLSVEEVFALSGAELEKFNYPGLGQEVGRLWKIYKGINRGYTEYDIHLAATCWKKLCRVLGEIEEDHKNNGKDVNSFTIDEINNKIPDNPKDDDRSSLYLITYHKGKKKKLTLEEKRQQRNQQVDELAKLICELSGKPVRKKPKMKIQDIASDMSLGDFIKEVGLKNSRQYLIPQFEGNTVTGFKFTSDVIRDLLIKEGSMLEAYVYYNVCESGYFDDLAPSYQFRWSNENVNSELDLVLIKGFQSAFVECKDTTKLEQGFYFKEQNLLNLFGVNSHGVLVTTHDMGENAPNTKANYTQIKRGNCMGIKTIYGLDHIENISNRLGFLFKN